MRCKYIEIFFTALGGDVYCTKNWTAIDNRICEKCREKYETKNEDIKITR